MNNSLQRVRKSRLSDQAAAELKRLIATGVYRGGSRLPSEAELARDLGVTRLTVREALSQLEAAGFTQTRHGSGTYVVDTAEIPTLGLLSELLGAGRRLTPAECLSLMEFRAVVVSGFVEALIERATEADLTELASIVEAEQALVSSPHPRTTELAELDYRINVVLARASQNLFYGLLMRSVRAVHMQLGAIIFEKNKDDGAIVAAHEAIVKALRSRRATTLRKSLSAYLEGGTALVRAWARTAGEGAPRLTAVHKPHDDER
ncbi:MAG: GntR family transcriptional regulator [Polyangiaceae bacterium]